jgi:hypothetical protein
MKLVKKDVGKNLAVSFFHFVAGKKEKSQKI